MIENLPSIAEVEIAAARWAAHEMFGFGLRFDGIVRKHHGGEIGTGASVVESALSSQQFRQLGKVHSQPSRVAVREHLARTRVARSGAME